MFDPLIPLLLSSAMGCDRQSWARQIVDLVTLVRLDISKAIAAIHVPTLVAVGDRDRICSPDDARRR